MDAAPIHLYGCVCARARIVLYSTSSRLSPIVRDGGVGLRNEEKKNRKTNAAAAAAARWLGEVVVV